MAHTLNDDEMALVLNPSVIFTKTKIINSVYHLFGDLSEIYKQDFTFSAIENNLSSTPKIAKGENYLGLPWVNLDYPRVFNKEGVFAVRTFFWWGNFFSITLHLSGKHKQNLNNQIKASITNGLLSGWYINSSDEQWEHHFEPDNYQLLTAEDVDRLLQSDFIKLAKKIPLKQWDESVDFFSNSFKNIILALGL